MRAVPVTWKYALLGTGLQVACCAIGIGWYSHLRSALERQDALEQGWARLSSSVHHSPDTVETIHVDADGRVCDEATGRPGLSEPQPQWRPGASDADTGVIRGVVIDRGQAHAGIARRSANGSHQVRFLREAHSDAGQHNPWHARTAFMSSLLLVTAVCGVVTYLVADKVYVKVQQQRAAAETHALSQIETLQRTRDGIIYGLAKLAEFRDEDTGSHLERISALATLLAQALFRQSNAQYVIDREFVRMIGVSAVLHDIGKVAVPDAILLKPGPLTADERTIMKRHAEIGAHCIAQIERRLGNSNYLQMAGEIAASHHERWDGSGYPLGLRGNEIPLAARIVAIVDVYDALTSPRVYKPPMSHKACMEIIRDEAGKHFDPSLARLFLEISKEVEEIALRYQSHLPPLPPPPMPLPRWNLARENEELVTTGDVVDGQLWLTTAP